MIFSDISIFKIAQINSISFFYELSIQKEMHILWKFFELDLILILKIQKKSKNGIFEKLLFLKFCTFSVSIIFIYASFH